MSKINLRRKLILTYKSQKKQSWWRRHWLLAKSGSWMVTFSSTNKNQREIRNYAKLTNTPLTHFPKKDFTSQGSPNPLQTPSPTGDQLIKPKSMGDIYYQKHRILPLGPLEPTSYCIVKTCLVSWLISFSIWHKLEFSEMREPHLKKCLQKTGQWATPWDRFINYRLK